MHEKLEKEISLNKEVISSLPINNIKNKKKCIEEIDKLITHYTEQSNLIYNELNSRIKPFTDISCDNFPEIERGIKQLSKALIYTNNLSSPYEKLGLDKIVYQIAHSKEDNLLDINHKLVKGLNIFSVVGINLTSDDFKYTKYVNEYMKVFFDKKNNLKDPVLKITFDKICWKCPNIISQIELNLRYLYLKNESKFIKYINEFDKKLLVHFKNGESNIIDNYSYFRNKLYSLNFNSKNNLLYDLINKKLNIEDYDDNKVKSIASKYFDGEIKDYIKVIEKLLNTLSEYQNYLKYKDIVIKIRELYTGELEKNYLKNKKKAIVKTEQKIFKINKKTFGLIKKTKIDKFELQVDNLVKEVKEIYDEIDSQIFKVIVKENMQENSTIFKALLLSCQYYSFLAECFTEDDVTFEEIDNMIEEVYSFVLNPNNNLINNITFTEDVDFAEIICENYKKFNINLDKNTISDSQIDSVIKDLFTLITSYRIDLLNISKEEIKNYHKINSLKKVQ